MGSSFHFALFLRLILLLKLLLIPKIYNNEIADALENHNTQNELMIIRLNSDGELLLSINDLKSSHNPSQMQEIMIFNPKNIENSNNKKSKYMLYDAFDFDKITRLICLYRKTSGTQKVTFLILSRTTSHSHFMNIVDNQFLDLVNQAKIIKFANNSQMVILTNNRDLAVVSYFIDFPNNLLRLKSRSSIRILQNPFKSEVSSLYVKDSLIFIADTLGNVSISDLDLKDTLELYEIPLSQPDQSLLDEQSKNVINSPISDMSFDSIKGFLRIFFKDSPIGLYQKIDLQTGKSYFMKCSSLANYNKISATMERTDNSESSPNILEDVIYILKRQNGTLDSRTLTKITFKGSLEEETCFEESDWSSSIRLGSPNSSSSTSSTTFFLAIPVQSIKKTSVFGIDNIVIDTKSHFLHMLENFFTTKNIIIFIVSIVYSTNFVFVIYCHHKHFVSQKVQLNQDINDKPTRNQSSNRKMLGISRKRNLKINDIDVMEDMNDLNLGDLVANNEKTENVTQYGQKSQSQMNFDRISTNASI